MHLCCPTVLLCARCIHARRLGYERALLRLLDRLVAEMDRKASLGCFLACLLLCC